MTFYHWETYGSFYVLQENFHLITTILLKLCWELGSFSAEGVGHQGLVAPERRGRHPGTFGIVSFWTVRLRDTSFLSLAQHSRTPVCALLANLPAASGLHGGGATPLNKWGSLHNTGDSNWGPPT